MYHYYWSGMHGILVVFLAHSVDHVLLIPDAGEAKQLGYATGNCKRLCNCCNRDMPQARSHSEEYEERRTKLLRDAKMG